MQKNNFFISTAIDYPSGFPHCGHLYEKITTDVIARWHRLKGEKIHFSTGLDSHGSKIARYAKEAKKTPQEFVKSMEPFFLKLCKEYNISYDDFIKTTEKRHEKVVIEMIKDLYKKGDIYKGKYSGYYCSDCETYFSKEDLKEGINCPTHNKPTEFLEEESYFFKMSKYQKKLLNHIKKNQNYIKPSGRKTEILNRLKEPLRDLSLTREKVEWGIPFPLDKKFVVAIWIDALINYLTTIKYPDKSYKDFWPALHIIGLDISWHHTVIWGTWLLASNIELPEVFIHGFIRSSTGEKMSKSLGNVINPLEIVKNYPSDSIRYYLIREIPFGQDGDFSEEVLINRTNNELANDLGNLVSRVLALVENNFKTLESTQLDKKLTKKLDIKKIDSYMEKIELHNALSEIWKFINECNKYINENKIWELKEEKLQKHLYTLLESIRVISILLSPFLPETSEKISKQLNIKLATLKDCKFSLIKNYKVKKSDVLFKKIDKKNLAISQTEKNKKINFQDLDLRVAEIKGIKDHPNADKLYIIHVDLGKFDKDLQIVSGLKDYYTKDELLSKKIIIIYNLENSIIRDIESHAMLLAVEDNTGKLALLTASKSIPGSKVYTDSPDIKEAKEVSYNQFKSIKIKTKNNKVYYQELPLKTDKEGITLDKDMQDNLMVE